MTRAHARRAFLQYLAASPVLASGLWSPLRGVLAAADEGRDEALESGELISSVEEAINVFDFHAAARNKLPPAHYGYLATGTSDDATLRANRSGYKRWQLRVRRLVDVSEVDASVKLLGTRWPSPIVLSPVGNQYAFHPEGEAAVARAARETSSLQILSTVSNTAVEEVTRERGAPVWFQLYPGDDWEITKALLGRAEAAGCPVVAMTVDSQGGSNRETFKRFAKKDNRDCTLCHDRDLPNNVLLRKPIFYGLDLSKLTQLSPRGATWELVRRIRDATGMKLFLKGIVTAEDAELCVQNGVQGVIVSNHGGRAEPSGRGTIESLPEVVSAVRGRIPVIVDGGVRRGVDVFKALALGADAVGIGRPYIWGLAAFGQPGVRAVVTLMQAELEMAMRQAGTTSISEISREYLVPSG
jgi:4-hydroxymandelate oxidase